MSTEQTPQALEAELARLRGRIDTVVAAVVDEDIHQRLSPLRDHLSTAAMLLRHPTDANLKRVVQRVRYTKKQLDLLTTWPGSPAQGPYAGFGLRRNVTRLAVGSPPMSSAPQPDHLQDRLSELLRRAKGLHGDVSDRRIRGQLRTLVRQIQTCANSLDEDADDKARLSAVGMLEVFADLLQQLESAGRRSASS